MHLESFFFPPFSFYGFCIRRSRAGPAWIAFLSGVLIGVSLPAPCHMYLRFLHLGFVFNASFQKPKLPYGFLVNKPPPPRVPKVFSSNMLEHCFFLGEFGFSLSLACCPSVKV